MVVLCLLLRDWYGTIPQIPYEQFDLLFGLSLYSGGMVPHTGLRTYHTIVRDS